MEEKYLIYYRPEFVEAIFQKMWKYGPTYPKLQGLQEEADRIRKQFYGTGVIDRLNEKNWGLRTLSFDVLPPNEEVELPDLITLLDAKAQRLCRLNRPIDVLYSGGIDSTATLLLLKEHAESDQLRVIMSPGSIDEYPDLYDTLVQYMPHVINDGNIRAEIVKHHITVHGNEADTLFSAGSLSPVGDEWDFYSKIRFGWFWRRYRDFEGVPYDNVVIENCESLFTDYDVQRWFITKHLRNELHREHISNPEGYLQGKMELRDYIFNQTGDRSYAYGKGKVISLKHGQLDAFEGTCRNVAVLADGTVIRRDQLKDIDPAPYISR
tara:strand:- start:22266 stop:23234 length:969 start_codon:yes stop_codon:yes gene_type:complete